MSLASYNVTGLNQLFSTLTRFDCPTITTIEPRNISQNGLHYYLEECAQRNGCSAVSETKDRLASYQLKGLNCLQHVTKSERHTLHLKGIDLKC